MGLEVLISFSRHPKILIGNPLHKHLKSAIF